MRVESKGFIRSEVDKDFMYKLYRCRLIYIFKGNVLLDVYISV